MGKILMWIVAAIAGIVFYKAVKARKNVADDHRDQQGMNNQRNNDSRLDNNGKTEAMLLCGVCGVHLPASETTARNGIISCSDTHACSHKRP